MSESEKPLPDEIPATSHAGAYVARMFFGILWIVIVFALFVGAIYLCWPWLHEKFSRFYS